MTTIKELRIPPELDEFKYAFHDCPRAIRAILEYTLTLVDPSNSGSIALARTMFELDETTLELDKLG